MPEGKESALTRWESYRPSKAVWLWSCVGTAVFTMLIGFTWGGWTTAGTAREMAATAAEDAATQLVSAACVEKFLASPGASERLAKLKDATSWKRPDLIKEGGWVTLAGMESPFANAAGPCANQLADMEVPSGNAGALPEANGT